MKNTKTISIILMTIIMISIIASFASAALVGSTADEIANDAVVEAELLYYQPVPAHPGDTLDVYIQLNNKGGKASKAGEVNIINSYPFSAISDNEGLKEFPSIPAGESYLIKTKIRVDKNAVEGDNNLRVDIQEDNSPLLIKNEFIISITGQSSSLSISEVKTTPEQLSPGEKSTIEITVKNVGDTKLRNIDLALGLDDLSLAPIGSSNSKTINELLGGETYTFSFEVVSYPGAESNVYQLPVSLSYEDETGNTKNQDETVGILIGSTPELLVYFEKIDLTQEAPQGEVIVKFVNKGLSEIKLMELEILESEDVEVIGESNLVYIGNIEADDYESADLNIEVTGENAVLPIKIKYKDTLNNPYEETINLPINLKTTNGNSSLSKIWFVVIILIAGLVFWFYKKKKKSKKKR